jgi:hypothetical protein
MTRTPRTLVASKGLLEALSLCARAASHVPVRGARRARPTLSLSHVARVEDEIGARLHDDVLVLLAIVDPMARMLTGLASTMSIAEAAEDFDAPKGYVRIATVYSDPIGELVDGAHGGAYVDVLAPRDPTGEEAQLLVAHDGHVERATRQTLSAFIVSALDDAVGRGALPSYGTPAATPLAPAPRLTGTAKPRGAKKPPGTERAHHPKFGDGVVMARIGDGADEKLVIAFAGGERTLLASRVTLLD